ncbi:MAG: class I SAM-dependent methyltransferase [Candidatus Hodarchaeota archaeon]
MSHLGKADWTDSDRIQSMIDSYSERYGKDFWEPFIELLGSKESRIVADFGCGPGLFLKDAIIQLNAEEVHGFDASRQMLKTASKILRESAENRKLAILLRTIDFDTDPIDIESESLDLAFSGYMLHEVVNPLEFARQIYKTMKSRGSYAVFDFISGNQEAFIVAMTERGMPEERARKRYPHMCKHSIEDIIGILNDAGFSVTESKRIGDFRALVLGTRE